MVRPAVSDDVDGIARMHIRSFQAGHRGIISAESLDSLNVEDRAQRWREGSLSPDVTSRTAFVAEKDGRIVGVADCGEPEENDDAAPGEARLYAIYVDPDAWGQGVGRKLYEACRDHLISEGWQSVFIRVAAENDRARRFYERMGGYAVAGSEAEHVTGTDRIRIVKYAVHLTSQT